MSTKTEEIKMIEVFHNSDYMEFGRKLSNEDKELDVPKELLEKVADVKTTGLDAAYCLTNNIEYPWPENVEVTAIKDKPRSTSVGDVMIMDGISFMVADHGFKKVNLVDKT